MNDKKIKSNVFDVLNKFNLDDIDIEPPRKEPPEAKPKTKKERRGRPKQKNLIRERGAQQGLPPTEIRKTYIMDIEIVERIEEYADKTGKTIKESINELLQEGLKRKFKDR